MSARQASASRLEAPVPRASLPLWCCTLPPRPPAFDGPARARGDHAIYNRWSVIVVKVMFPFSPIPLSSFIAMLKYNKLLWQFYDHSSFPPSHGDLSNGSRMRIACSVYYPIRSWCWTRYHSLRRAQARARWLEKLLSSWNPPLSLSFTQAWCTGLSNRMRTCLFSQSSAM